MKSALFALLALAVLLISACGSPAAPVTTSPEPIIEATAEIVAEATLEVSHTENPGWVTITQPAATNSGWALQYPEGWELVGLDARNIFLYSSPNAGTTLFTTGLEPGQLVFQISLNLPTEANQDITGHLNILTGSMRDFVFTEAAPYSAAGLDGVQQTGTSERLGMTILATSRKISVNPFLDIFVYSRTDELEAQRPLIDTVIETVRFVFATE